MTTGPGAISVAVALGSGHPHDSGLLVQYFLGITVATVALSIVIWITYRSADRISRLMGPRGSRTVTRITAFLLLCIGVQILITGVDDVLTPLLGPHRAGRPQTSDRLAGNRSKFRSSSSAC